FYLGVIEVEETTIGAIIDDPNFFVDFFFLPIEAGDTQIFVTVDLENGISEADENNNSKIHTITVKDTSGLYLHNIELIDLFQREPEDVGNTVAEGGRFISWVYPVTKSEFTNTFSPTPYKSLSYLTGTLGFFEDAQKLWLKAIKESNGSSNRAVAIVPQEYLDFHTGCSKVAGTVVDKTLFVVGGSYTTTAHELGHSYQLGEGYEWLEGEDPCRTTIINKGEIVSGYNVELRSPITDVLDFMGVEETPKIFDEWVSRVNFEHLFSHPEFLENPEDPEILIITGLIDSDGVVKLGVLERLIEGVPSVTQSSEYLLNLFDNQGQTLQTTPIYVDFVMERDPLHPIQLEIGVFMLTIPYPEKALFLEIVHKGEKLLELDITTTLLHHAVDAIPDFGFVKNPDQRRNALHNKINEINEKIQSGDIESAVNKLQFDVKPKLEMWLIDNYQPEDVFQYSKAEIISLVNEMIERLVALD
ncbi:MAG: hypothetical protein QXX08_08480, partial [Candidatus Bathyarchaeia archaeon]